MSIQSLMTPAMFMVSADVLPISRNTAYSQWQTSKELIKKLRRGSNQQERRLQWWKQQ